MAYILAMVLEQTVGRTTENAGGFELLKNDPVVIQVDLQLIPLRDIQGSPQFDWKNDPAQLVHLADDSCCFHTDPALS